MAPASKQLSRVLNIIVISQLVRSDRDAIIITTLAFSRHERNTFNESLRLITTAWLLNNPWRPTT